MSTMSKNTSFIHDDFLLSGETARRLYHDYAEGLPIFDYHCHLSPAAIAGDARFANLTEAWLAGDHYKWRAMRAAGVAERLITGDADSQERFAAWAGTVPQTLGNPLYHWTHLELARYFGITDLLSPETAARIFEEANAMLAEPSFSVRGLLSRMKVRFVCTTDDPTDSLEHHRRLAGEAPDDLLMVPAFRPDGAIHIEAADDFRAFAGRLQGLSGHELDSFDAFLDALISRVGYFHDHGARISDHAFVAPRFAIMSEKRLNEVYRRVRSGGGADDEEVAAFQTAVFLRLGRAYAERDWAMQLHIGALRSNSTRGLRDVGKDSGFDSMADAPFAADLNRLLDALDRDRMLPRTIVYTLNPAWNDVLATTIGNFQDGSVPGKIQFGSGWWFNDQKEGMRDQMTSLANHGLLARFVGMLTDSRSFLSFPRHEYFRRVLCDLVGSWVDTGDAPRDFGLLGGMIRDISWNNADRYFGYDLGGIDG